MPSRIPISGLVVVGLALGTMTISGCASVNENAQLAAVAKDWSRMIRASQIIPVYPLTEDLRPGDLFLVETAIQKQQLEYDAAGFLRLDQQLGRLQGIDFGSYYTGHYGIGPDLPPPGVPEVWQPDPPPPDSQPRWPKAPRVAFPTYSFKVSKGKGASLALPISGVPIGLALMQTSEAVGSVTITDAYTYGVSLDELREGVIHWFNTGGHHALLTDLSRQAGQVVYLRAIARVFLTAGVVVSMTNTSSRAAQADVGSSKEVKIIEQTGDRAANYKAALEAINTTPLGTPPGGSVKIAQASQRNVSLNEKFARPLVIGYLAFDFPVDSLGQLGVPVATRNVLRDQPRFVPMTGLTSTERQYFRLVAWVDAQASDRRIAIYDRASKLMPDAFQRSYTKAKDQNPDDAFARAMRQYTSSVRPLARAMDELYVALDRAEQEAP